MPREKERIRNANWKLQYSNFFSEIYEFMIFFKLNPPLESKHNMCVYDINKYLKKIQKKIKPIKLNSISAFYFCSYFLFSVCYNKRMPKIKQCAMQLQKNV